MILYLDTVLNDKILLALLKEEGKSFVIIALKQISAPRQQSEKLLPSIDALLKKNNLTNKNIKKIIVNNHGGSFTSLRIGVITANALAFALKIPVVAGVLNRTKTSAKIDYLKGSKSFANYFLVEPYYNAEPKIGQKKPC